jgi:antitoxin HigA-1
VVEDKVMTPVHSGEVLLEEFLAPLGVSQYQLAKAVDVPARRINEIVHGQRRITADTALRLSRYFGTSERFWLNLQARYDLETEKDRLGAALEDIRRLAQPADQSQRLTPRPLRGSYGHETARIFRVAWPRSGSNRTLLDQRKRARSCRYEPMSARCLSGRWPSRSGFSVSPAPRLGPC